MVWNILSGASPPWRITYCIVPVNSSKWDWSLANVGRRMRHLALMTADNKICVSNFFCPYSYLKFLSISFNCSLSSLGKLLNFLGGVFCYQKIWGFFLQLHTTLFKKKKIPFIRNICRQKNLSYNSMTCKGAGSTVAMKDWGHSWEVLSKDGAE